MQMTTRPDLAPSARRGRAAAMLLTGFVTQNLAVGTTFGAYGLIVDALSREFHASHSLVALGMGMIALCLGLLAPLAGTLLDRWSVRSVMMLGAVFAAVGFLAASQAQSIGVFLFCFGALGGIGITFIGPLPSAKLAGGWFPQAPGKAIGFVAIPLLIAVGPPLYSRWIGAYGWRSLFTLLGVVFLLLVPLLWFVREPPAGAAAGAPHGGPPGSASGRSGSFGDCRVWQIGVISGLLLAGGVVLSTHVVSHATRQGIEAGDAALLLSVLGIAASLGSLLWGGIADRFGPVQALKGLAVIQALFWVVIIQQGSFATLATVVALLSICGGGVHPAICSTVASVYGQAHFGAVLGRVMLLITPFNFVAAPLAGMLLDMHGSYTTAFYLMAALNAGALALLLVLASRFRPGEPALS